MMAIVHHTNDRGEMMEMLETKEQGAGTTSPRTTLVGEVLMLEMLVVVGVLIQPLLQEELLDGMLVVKIKSKPLKLVEDGPKPPNLVEHLPLKQVIALGEIMLSHLKIKEEDGIEIKCLEFTNYNLKLSFLVKYFNETI
jgi:hypothetical protein